MVPPLPVELPGVELLARYLSEMARIGATGEANDETSYYPALAELLNMVGGTLSPRVHCVLTPKNRGAGIPDGGLFLKRTASAVSKELEIETRAPERGAVEVKPLRRNMNSIVSSAQVRKYLGGYGRVLVTNYREFAAVQIDADGEIVRQETFALAADEAAFWALHLDPVAVAEKSAAFEEYLRRMLAADAPVTSPEGLASYLAAHARIARERVELAGELPKLRTLRDAFEGALGLRFEGKQGQDFFHSALVQTLFYGVFAAWVAWTDCQPDTNDKRFEWRMAQWTLNVPMVRALFEQLATPQHLPAGLDEILDWTDDVFARVDREAFFARFERRDAVRYFYEPFLEAYDPDLRRQLGVWYTPPEVVRYMVGRVHEALKRDLDLPLGLADDCVHVLDPCTGTGSFLIETLRTVSEVLQEEHGDSLVAEQAKQAALERIHGFEVLPAPFIIAHLQVGLWLAELGAPLSGPEQERPSIYLTNALTGWGGEDESLLPFDEFRVEREAAGTVKRSQPILVVIGNPPYNGFPGVRDPDTIDLVGTYKDGLADPPWEITKNKLDDYYIRFYRIAEQKIAERTGRGIICFVSNFGWLSDPSAVVMRKRLLQQFDDIYVDNLNGDSRETGKKTPDGGPDPSVFSSKFSASGIQVGTAVALLVRTDPRSSEDPTVMYRDFWGPEKRAELEASLHQGQQEPTYSALDPQQSNWFRLRPWNPRPGYESWPAVTELADVDAELGLNENRGEALISLDHELLLDRMKHFLDPELAFDELEPARVGGLVSQWADYDSQATRAAMLASSPFDPARLARLQFRPFDIRWSYVDTTPKLWNRPRPRFLKASDVGSDFLLVRRRAPRTLDGAAFLFSSQLVDQHVLHKDAYAIPLLLAQPETNSHPQLFADAGYETETAWRPNLSPLSRDYLARLGYEDNMSRDTARLLWLHVLAIGYSPLYLQENGDAIRSDWPRVPVPATAEMLEESAGLGVQISALLDIDTPLPGLDESTRDRLRNVGVVWRTDGHSVTGDDRAITVGWGVLQRRKQKSGVESRIVMPGDGATVRRARTTEEQAGFSKLQLAQLGSEVVDVYLNQNTCWRGVPEAAWNFKVGGYQVLRKWLSYRELDILGRPLTLTEVRQFTSITRRLTEIVLLEPVLDANYRSATGAVDQDCFPELVSLEHT